MSKGGRDDKRAAALRANLHRRKAQARGRADLVRESQTDLTGADAAPSDERTTDSGRSGRSSD